jgi:hypothetical protein
MDRIYSIERKDLLQILRHLGYKDPALDWKTHEELTTSIQKLPTLLSEINALLDTSDSPLGKELKEKDAKRREHGLFHKETEDVSETEHEEGYFHILSNNFMKQLGLLSKGIKNEEQLWTKEEVQGYREVLQNQLDMLHHLRRSIEVFLEKRRQHLDHLLEVGLTDVSSHIAIQDQYESIFAEICDFVSNAPK